MICSAMKVPVGVAIAPPDGAEYGDHRLIHAPFAGHRRVRTEHRADKHPSAADRSTGPSAGALDYVGNREREGTRSWPLLDLGCLAGHVGFLKREVAEFAQIFYFVSVQADSRKPKEVVTESALHRVFETHLRSEVKNFTCPAGKVVAIRHLIRTSLSMIECSSRGCGRSGLPAARCRSKPRSAGQLRGVRACQCERCPLSWDDGSV
jgi:hypothetical protein